MSGKNIPPPIEKKHPVCLVLYFFNLSPLAFTNCFEDDGASGKTEETSFGGSSYHRVRSFQFHIYFHGGANAKMYFH